MGTIGMVAGQLVPRPLRDVGETLSMVTRNKGYSTRGNRWFPLTTVERLLFAGLTAGVARLVPAPKWAVYGALSVISLPAAVAMGASELAYCGLKSFGSAPNLLARSALSLGASWLLFENYDRIHLNRGGYSRLHLKPEFEIRAREGAWSQQVGLMFHKETSWSSSNFWGWALVSRR